MLDRSAWRDDRQELVSELGSRIAGLARLSGGLGPAAPFQVGLRTYLERRLKRLERALEDAIQAPERKVDEYRRRFEQLAYGVARSLRHADETTSAIECRPSLRF